MELIATFFAIILTIIICILLLVLPIFIGILITIKTFDYILQKHEKRMHEHIQIAIEDALHNHKYDK